MKAQPVVTVCFNSDVSRTRYSTIITVRCSPCLSDWWPVEEMFDIDHRCSSTNEVAQYVFIKPQPTRQLLPVTVRSSTKRPQCPCVFVDSEDERYMMLVLRSQFYHVVRRWPCLSGWWSCWFRWCWVDAREVDVGVDTADHRAEHDQNQQDHQPDKHGQRRTTWQNWLRRPSFR